MLFLQMTGMSGAGKSTLSYAVKKILCERSFRVEIIDGDDFRKTLCSDLGFSKEDRHENIRRLGSIGISLALQGIIAIMPAINPYECIRQELKQAGRFVKTAWVDCSLETLLHRDTKGLYRKALLPDGHPEKINNLSGINDPYEIPQNPDLTIQTHRESIESCVDRLLNFILSSVGQPDS